MDGQSSKAEQLRVEPESEEYYNLVFGLCQMFDEIDINGDGTMEWSELL